MAIRYFHLSMIFALHGTSTATFHIRPSATSTLSMAELRATNCHKHEQMYSCYMGCLQDPCCVAVKLSGQCEMSYEPTEELDIVKEVGTLIYLCTPKLSVLYVLFQLICSYTLITYE